MYTGFGMMHIGGNNSEYFPQLGDGPPHSRFLKATQWWEQVVMVLVGVRITRKEIVLAAANKDGGAHVDQSLTSEYQALSSDGAVGAFVYETQGERIETPIQDAHLVSLRQMGYELLHSPMLLKLL